jgi:hypothetical protein
MTDDGIEFNPNRSEDFIPGVPKPRKPERVGKPRRATEADLKAAMDRIVADILRRDGQSLSEIRYRGKGRR